VTAIEDAVAAAAALSLRRQSSGISLRRPFCGRVVWRLASVEVPVAAASWTEANLLRVHFRCSALAQRRLIAAAAAVAAAVVVVVVVVRYAAAAAVATGVWSRNLWSASI